MRERIKTREWGTPQKHEAGLSNFIQNFVKFVRLSPDNPIMTDLDKETTRNFFDNINYKVVDDLRVTLRKGSKVSIASACFSIYAFNELREQLEGLDELRFIFTAPSFLKEREPKQRREFYIPRIDRERTLYGSQFEVRLRNQLTQKAIAIECAEWIRQRVRFKSTTTNNILQGFINVKGDSCFTYTPVNGFTTTDLGCERGNNMMNFVNKVDGENAKQHLRVFNELWNNELHHAR